MTKPDYHTDSIHCFLKDAVENMPEIENVHGQMEEFSYGFVAEEEEDIEAAYPITADNQIFKITVTRFA